jgi:hypothetical protein
VDRLGEFFLHELGERPFRAVSALPGGVGGEVEGHRDQGKREFRILPAGELLTLDEMRQHEPLAVEGDRCRFRQPGLRYDGEVLRRVALHALALEGDALGRRG